MQIPQHVDPFKNHLGDVKLNMDSIGNWFRGGTVIALLIYQAFMQLSTT